MSIVKELEQGKGKFKVIKIFLSDSNKFGKNGKLKKKSEKIFKGGDLEFMIYLMFKVKDNLLVGKIIRKIDFD